MKTRINVIRSFGLLLLFLFVSCFANAQEKNRVQLISSGDLILKGIKCHDKKDYEKAEEYYKKVSRNDTNYSWALYELGINYSAQEKYDESIECGKQGLKLFDKTSEVDFYILLGNSYDYIDSNETAIKYYKEALELYPNNQSLIYNYAICLYKKKDYNEAEKTLFRSLTINPFHANSHLYLGFINIMRGRLMPGVLCLNTALLMNPDGERGNYYLSALEQAYSGELEKELKKDAPAHDGEVNTNFQDIETLIKSDFALNKKYKTKAKISFIVVKQAQLIFDQLKEDKEQKDFYTRFYVPLFRFIADEGLVEEFSYFIMQSADNEDIQDWIKNKANRIKKFTEASGGFIANKRQFGFDPENEKTKKIYYYFTDNHALKSYGSYDDKKEKVRSGKWTFFYSNGTLQTTETYEHGKLNGSSTFYNKDRSMEKVLNYENDEVVGKAVFYNAYGEKHSELDIKNGKINGAANYFNSSGYPDQMNTFVDGKIKGPGKVFYNNGQLKQEFIKIEDKLDGPAKTFHPDGSVDLVTTLKKGNLDGAYISLYANGNKKTEGKNVNDNRTGKWIEYYSNGTVKSESTYNDKGKINGIVKNYYNDGKIESEENYGSNGKMDGKSTYYDYDGKLYYEFIYRNDKLDEVLFYDKSGKQIKQFETKKGVLTIDFLYPNGIAKYSGTFKEGQEDGLFKYYNSLGVLTSEQSFKKGKKQGKYTSYYPNGKVKETVNYKDNQLDGYVIQNHPNGIINYEGWYKEGRLQGDWYQYHLNGTIAYHSYYVNGESHGFQEYYNQDGRKYMEHFYDNGLFLRYTQFDTSGVIYNDCELKAGKGKLKKLNTNGSILEISNMIMGNKFDTVKQYNINGTLTFYGFSIDGNMHGMTKTYDDDGLLKTEMGYSFGSKEGIEKNYEDNQISSTYEYMDGNLENKGKVYKEGKLKVEMSYRHGDRDGYTTYYANEGQVAYRLFYVRGDMVSYSYLDKNGKFVPEIQIVDGKGKVVAYYQNGKKSVEFEMLNGERNGAKIDYSPDGKVREEYHYLDGQYHGTAKEYYVSGKLKKEMEYNYDLLNGVCHFYNPNGSIKKEMPYENGEINGVVKIYNQSGKLIKTRKYYYDTFVEETNIR